MVLKGETGIPHWGTSPLLFELYQILVDHLLRDALYKEKLPPQTF